MCCTLWPRAIISWCPRAAGGMQVWVRPHWGAAVSTGSSYSAFWPGAEWQDSWQEWRRVPLVQNSYHRFHASQTPGKGCYKGCQPLLLLKKYRLGFSRSESVYWKVGVLPGITKIVHGASVLPHITPNHFWRFIRLGWIYYHVKLSLLVFLGFLQPSNSSSN